MYILVKNLNGRLIFIMDNEVDFEVLLNELKGLLVQSFFKKKDYGSVSIVEGLKR